MSYVMRSPKTGEVYTVETARERVRLKAQGYVEEKYDAVPANVYAEPTVVEDPAPEPEPTATVPVEPLYESVVEQFDDES